MRWLKSLVLAAVAMFVAAPTVRAETLDAKRVPGGVKWLLHIDADALRASGLWKILREDIEKNPEWAPGVAHIEELTGMKFPDQLHGITVFGSTFTESGAVILINADVNQTKILNLLQLDPNYTSYKHNNHEVHGWQDKGKQLYGAFHGAGWIAVGQSRDRVEAALDTGDGKGEALKAGAPVANGNAPGLLAYLAGSSLAELKELQAAKTPLINELDMAWLAVGEQEKDMVLRAALTTKTPQVAEQLRASAEGLKAIVTLAAMNENADQGAKFVAELLKFVTVKAQEKVVSADMKMPIDNIRGLIEKAQAMKAAEGAKKAPKAPAAPQE